MPGASSEAVGNNLKGYSCLNCRQRKVKCDQHTPCSNCVKADKQCSFTPPVRGKRKRTKPPREGLHAKLRRYEQLLQAYGAKVDPDDSSEDTDTDTASRADVKIIENAEPRVKSTDDHLKFEETRTTLVTQEGRSRYFDNTLWSSLGDEFQQAEAGGEHVPNVSDSALFFEPENMFRTRSLENIHPSIQTLPKLKEIYVDRVDPMIKVLHIPSFWDALINGLQNPQDLPKSLEAVVFAFYFATVTTLNEEECQSIFGASKSAIYSQYRSATRQALINARLLSTSSPMTLQAFLMFIMCERKSYGCDILFILSGIAVRLARKMGLHRDGAFLGLPPFETEMRRRLWWNIVHIDFAMADVLGTRPSMDLSCGDTKVPLNVEDEDLQPNMVEAPPERKGITSVTLHLIKCEIRETLRRFSTAHTGDVRWEALYNRDFTTAKKDSIISQLEDRFETKYLRYHDPSNPLHTFLSILMRSSICKMKMFVHSPRPFGDRPVKVSQSERDKVFMYATKLLEYVILVHGNPELKKYMWQIGTSHVWIMILYVLIESRHRRTGPAVDRSWQLIEAVSSHCPQIFEGSTGAVYATLGKWTLEVWDEYVAASKAEGLPEPATPAYISAIRRGNTTATEPVSTAKDTAEDPAVGSRAPSGHSRNQSQWYDGAFADLESLDFSHDFPNLSAFETDPNEWMQWEQLIADQGGFAPVDLDRM